jgi:hypothetical protein
MVGRGGNSRNWLSPSFMLIHYSMAKYDNIPGHVQKSIQLKFKELWQGRK